MAKNFIDVLYHRLYFKLYRTTIFSTSGLLLKIALETLRIVDLPVY
jgi:hypothetical protein